jgi:hypothetical protein
VRTVLAAVALVSIAAAVWSSPAGGDPAAARRVNGPGRTNVRAPAGAPRVVIRTAAGASERRLELVEPAGVIRLLAVIASPGVRVEVTGVIPGLAEVGISTPRTRSGPPEACAHRGGVVVCTEALEACPMPSATWRFRVRKLSGPAGRIRIDFVVGPGPRR